MNLRSRKIVAGTILVIIGLTVTVPAMADNTSQINNLTQQQSQLNDKKSEIKGKLQNTVIAKNQTLAELEKINKEMNDVQLALENLEASIADTETKIEATAIEIDNKQRDYDGRMAIFNQRLKEMYQYGDVNFIEVLLQASSVTDFLTRFEYLKYIANNDQKLLEEVTAIKESLEEQKASLDSMKASLEAQKKEQESKHNQLETASIAKKNIVAQISEEEDTYYDMLDAVEKESNQIENELRRLQMANSGNTSAPGAYLWPCPSSKRITSNYGYRIHPISGVKKLHSGMDIGASYGSAVVAAAGGKVIKSEYYGGYGNCIIIDHGGGHATLYGHMSSLIAKVGQEVAAGAQIGKVGSTGASTGNHLHFEVRINGATTDPAKHL